MLIDALPLSEFVNNWITLDSWEISCWEVVTDVSEAVTGVSEVVTGVSLAVAVVLVVSVTRCELLAVASSLALLRVCRDVAATWRVDGRLAGGDWVVFPLFRFGGMTNTNSTDTKLCKQAI